MARTRHEPGLGSLRAGRLLRVLTEVQRLDAEGHSWTDIREELQLVLDGERSLDGLTLETGAEDAVRLLNVHKAKGLEAPVVILADPYGGRHPKPPNEHVRREAGEVVLPVYEQHRYHRTLRFAPQRWATEFQETEARYQWAEEQRLLYVAATRAEDQLIVSRYRSPSWSEDKGYWAPLYPFLGEASSLEPPDDAPQFRPAPVAKDTSSETMAARRAHAAQATYATTTVTEAPSDADARARSGGYGKAFGRAVHRLFEHAIQHRPSVDSPGDLDAVLNRILSQHDAAHQAQTARRMLASFLDSPLWAAVKSADVVHTEFPVAGVTNADLPTLTDGTIDLLYRRDEAWHLIDFKTDRVASFDPAEWRTAYKNQVQTYAQLWERATDAPIVQSGLWMADVGEMILIDTSDTGEAGSDVEARP
jgi:ATP-dependent helicase/nuclease subunit A